MPDPFVDLAVDPGGRVGAKLDGLRELAPADCFVNAASRLATDL